MKEHLINGRPWKECLEELRVYVEPTLEKGDGSGQKYHGIEECVQLFDRVLGNDHYTVEFSDQKYIQIRSEQDTISCKCRITIIDDEGDVVIFKEAYGGYDLRYSRGSEKESNLNNAPANACTYAFRACCKYFGAFGEYTGARRRGVASSNSNAKPKAGSKKNTASDESLMFETSGAFYVEGKTKDGPIHKVKARIVDENRQSDGLVDLVFFPRYKAQNADKFNQALDMSTKASFKMIAIVKRCEPINGVEQYAFKKFA